MNNRENYKVLSTCAELLALSCTRYPRQIWATAITRKNHICSVTGLVINKGAMCYRPLTNGYNRMDRICFKGMNILIDAANRR